MNINQVLENAPAVISERAERELAEYKNKLQFEEDYKQERARLFLILKAKDEMTLDEIRATLDTEPTLIEIKKKEMEAEINYKKIKIERERGQNKFEAAKCMGYLQKAELKNLNNTIQE